ncbi:MAG: SAM-dependent methyltransferase [Lentisphaeria bacterium]|nr:SAM-dependent methyltransferase [Lentisphaeria bacterium]
MLPFADSSSRPPLAGLPPASYRCTMTHLHLCKTGFERMLERELPLHGEKATRVGPGWVLAAPGRSAVAEQGLDPGFCFATASVLDARLVAVESANRTAEALCEAVWQGFQNREVPGSWPLHLEADDEDLTARLRVARGEFRKRLKRKMGRLAGLAEESPAERGELWHGLYARLVGYGELLVGNEVREWGQRRMRDTEDAPSRSYLKVEEAYGILGRAPGLRETVVDLGAAPGGWSFSAAEKGATVQAVDNGPLKGGAKDHPGIRHVPEDAFRFRPADKGVDWLFCDMIESPYRVLDEILLPWIDRGWCRRFVVNLKVGKMDPIPLLQRLHGDGRRGLRPRCQICRIRQLFHDREEITCVGEVARD